MSVLSSVARLFITLLRIIFVETTSCSRYLVNFSYTGFQDARSEERSRISYVYDPGLSVRGISRSTCNHFNIPRVRKDRAFHCEHARSTGQEKVETGIFGARFFPARGREIKREPLSTDEPSDSQSRTRLQTSTESTFSCDRVPFSATATTDP